ncbi:glycosyltransferase family 2 protein [Candidatus Nomurabacteria bacterium]|uniref:Glycosyltransferase family 2 protein n=1 Tax=Candidatus Dojkabacteria bacterium TaxID=2099670 RepID=A0A955I1C6_9BACT|nr:glycosyltransferase family 2 protein [Candidatus Dojkabacteria bacterium]MCB9790206.1 glycosyltransferase family 2 protein [Candidatus Nomurabacteria bacterium]MCB9803274.1 glycosyltransferase family 2 protein [Candidatus Nomurabacteria bacterium]
MDKEIKASILVQVVAYKSLKELTECLDCLLADPVTDIDLDISILDNSSEIDITSDLRERFPTVTFATSDKNLGFGKAHNRIFQNSHDKQYDHILILNPDSRISSKDISALVSIAQETGAGVVAPSLYNDNEDEASVIYMIPGLLLPFYVILSKLGLIDKRYGQTIFKNRAEVEAVSGACMLIKADLFRDLKGFDEDFFMYYEDHDLCRRIRSTGMKILIEPSIRAFHHIGTASKDHQDQKAWLWLQAIYSQALFYYKHDNILGASVAKLVTLGLLFVGRNRISPEQYKETASKLRSLKR